MRAPIDDEDRDSHRGDRCAECSAALAVGQRYCLECGSRCAPLPAAVAERIGALLRRTPPSADPDIDEAVEPSALERLRQRPQAAAVAVMALLAFGVIIGSVTGPLAQSAGTVPILLEEPEAASTSEAEPEGAEPTTLGEASAPTAPLAASLPAPAPAPLEAPVEAPPPASAPPELPPEEVLPPITHVFLIVLGDQGFEEAFGPRSAAPYVSRTLRGEGELLSNYYAVTAGSLANEIALISGQGPTEETAANCPTYSEIAAPTVGEAEQVLGGGCVYPPETPTLPGQLSAAGMTWRAYVEGSGDGGAGCRHPSLGAADPNHSAGPSDPYLTWRNPFVYFHSLIDGTECAEADLDLDRLTSDLRTAKSTPALSYIVPDACNSGEEAACEPGAPAGPAASDAFLEAVVPRIMESEAYRTGGLIAITFAQAPQTGPAADSSACCATPEYPNLPEVGEAPTSTGPVKASGGGGRVGMLLISPYVLPGSVDESGYYNHFSMLRSIEELFGLSALGYAAEPAVTPFDETVYNNLES